MHFSPPPRHVPLSLRVVNLFNGKTQIGLLIFGFGMLFFWTMFMRSDFSYINFRGDIARAAGRIKRVEETSAKESRRRVIAHHYEYSVAGTRYEGVSYQTGSAEDVGDRVRVEYLRDDPRKSRIAGMRRSLFSSTVQFILFIPLVGAVLVLSGTKTGLKRNHLLANGLPANGTLVDKSPTNVTENKKTVYALTFEFTARDGRRGTTVVRSSTPEVLEDQKQEPMLYDPADPSRSYLLDEVPARPQFDGTGQLVGDRRAAVRALILPVIVVLENALFVLPYAL